MATNINKYVQLNDFLLLEYEFNKSGDELTFGSVGSVKALNDSGSVQYFNTGAQGITNNTLNLNSVPTSPNRSTWYFSSRDTSGYWGYFDSSAAITGTLSYPFDTIRVHIVSGYNFEDVTGFLLQIRALDTSGNFVDLANFTWARQVLGTDVLKFSPNTLLLGNRFYDKYVEFKVPSVQELGGDIVTTLGQNLSIQALSDVYITYSTIPGMDVDTYIISEAISLQLPVESPADNFNCQLLNQLEEISLNFMQHGQTLSLENIWEKLKAERSVFILPIIQMIIMKILLMNMEPELINGFLCMNFMFMNIFHQEHLF